MSFLIYHSNVQGYCFAAFKIALRHVNTFNQECNYGYIFRPDVSSTEYPYLLETETATDVSRTDIKPIGIKLTRERVRKQKGLSLSGQYSK